MRIWIMYSFGFIVFFRFLQKTLFAAVDYYSSMANARVGNDGSSCIEKSSRVDWKGVGGMALGMIVVAILKYIFSKYVF
ncbi:MAG: hypothetical protein IJR86_03420 [Bacteroidaceae bacterium]|nr:hypothetical protein [Bacteroidaceae bacterium]